MNKNGPQVIAVYIYRKKKNTYNQVVFQLNENDYAEFCLYKIQVWFKGVIIKFL